MKNYYNLHLKCDVLLLPDVLEKPRTGNFKNYELQPSPYFSAPAIFASKKIQWLSSDRKMLMLL